MDFRKILRWSSLIFFMLTALHAEPVIISESEFRNLVGDLAPKVNLFKEIWNQDREAIIYGGTSRDFLYWVLKQLREGHSPEDLRKLDFIDIRGVVGSESDADVVSRERLDILGSQFGIRKVDYIPQDRLDIRTEMGASELHQGFVALEKIELAYEGLRPANNFQDGVHELFNGQIGFYSTSGDEFWETDYAKKNLNHPVFLAIRYLRIRAAHWYNTRGDGLPDENELLNYDPAIKAKIRSLIQSAIDDPQFREVIKNPKALEWLNGSVLKSFRSYTNRTAARLLFLDAGFQDLQRAFPQIASINQFLFSQVRDEHAIQANFDRYLISPNELFSPVSQVLPDFSLFHGTKTEENYRGILFQNALPSAGGSAGAGLYAVDEKNIQKAVQFAGGTLDRVTKFKVSDKAKVINLTSHKGQEVYERWSAANPEGSYDDFARDFGADILIYAYAPYAFVVKNSDILIGREGVSRKLMTLHEAQDWSKRVQTNVDFSEFARSVTLNAFSKPEIQRLLKRFSLREILKWAVDFKDQKNEAGLVQIALLMDCFPARIRQKLISEILGEGLFEALSHENQIVAFQSILGGLRKANRRTPEEVTEYLIKRRNLWGLILERLTLGAFSNKLENRLMNQMLADLDFHQEIARWFKKRKGYFRPFEYQRTMPWIEKLVQGAQVTKYLLEEEILMPPSMRASWLSMGLQPGFSRHKIRQWVPQFARMQSPPSGLLNLMECAAGNSCSKGVGRKRMEEWLTMVFENPNADAFIRTSALPKILDLRLNSEKLAEYVFESITDILQGLMTGYLHKMFEYLDSLSRRGIPVRAKLARFMLDRMIRGNDNQDLIPLKLTWFFYFYPASDPTSRALRKMLSEILGLRMKAAPELIGKASPGTISLEAWQYAALGLLPRYLEGWQYSRLVMDLNQFLELVFSHGYLSDRIKRRAEGIFESNPIFYNFVRNKLDLRIKLGLPDPRYNPALSPPPADKDLPKSSNSPEQLERIRRTLFRALPEEIRAKIRPESDCAALLDLMFQNGRVNIAPASHFK